MNSGSNMNEEEEDENNMNNSYRSWSIADDYYLYKFQKEPLTKFASKLGRGLVCVQKRIKKLNDASFVLSRFAFDEALHYVAVQSLASSPYD
mmetsp:Transcript_1390/g.2132  ORF Transcript_1390/g.2132 Transcript_1390/m.2132 type:complete len:92 (+) Transcript_1390:937-1212(+)